MGNLFKYSFMQFVAYFFVIIVQNGAKSLNKFFVSIGLMKSYKFDMFFLLIFKK